MSALTKIERRKFILDELKDKGRVTIDSLAKQLDCTSKTIRLDLKELERSDMITRFHGGAKSNADIGSAIVNVITSDLFNKVVHFEQKRTGKLFVFGSFNVDITSYIPHFPEPGETVRANQVTRTSGGKGTNQAVVANKNDVHVTLLVKVGNDHLNSYAKTTLKNMNFDRLFILESGDYSTGLAQIQVRESDGKHNISVYLGANEQINERELYECCELINNHDLLLVQLENNQGATEGVLRNAHQKAIPTILNASPFRPYAMQLLKYVDTLIADEREILQIANLDSQPNASITDAIKAISASGVKQIIVIGSDKSFWLYSEEQVEVIENQGMICMDETMINDSFVGCFAAKLVQGKGFYQSAHEASKYIKTTFAEKKISCLA
ncbi:PfkB family carbohydrate kinase [Vibrio rhodolitus]|uniref:PfkB family carbohydrate kinase n=1 Tax=Vibrio rhodolitus TaxID=2231649 RepID=UPI000E0BD166|nr:PfkB family carbohydrate kinase [Vibrio rhodolitus]